MSDPKFFRNYLDILNEAQDTATTQTPSQWQQAKDAIGQQYQNYKDLTAGADDAVKQGKIDPESARMAKNKLASTMMAGGWEAGKAALSGRDPSTAYIGGMFKHTGNELTRMAPDMDKMMKQGAAQVAQYRGPNAKDITQNPDFQKYSPEKQAEIRQAQEKIRGISDDELAQYTSGNAFQKMAADTKGIGQSMIDQKDQGSIGASGYSSKANAALGLDPTRQATDAELDAVAKQTPQTPVQEEDEELDRIKKLIRK
jgi:hypothetical protein